jgi:hypothetical protein
MESVNSREEASSPLGLSSETVTLKRGRRPESKYRSHNGTVRGSSYPRESLSQWENSPADIVTN